MRSSMDLSIVIPAYNEAERIGRTLEAVEVFRASFGRPMEMVVVNDGSRDATVSIVEEFRRTHPWVRLLTNERNLGKGGSLRRGMLEAEGEVVLFMDADLSVPLSDLPPMLGAMRAGDYPVAIGSRRVPGSVLVRRQPWLRESMGRVFTALARMLLHPEIVDFTCGFKAFRKREAREIFSRQERSDWVFDAEILHLARLLGYRVLQHPVHWEHREGSRVRLFRVVGRTLLGLLQVRWKSAKIVAGDPLDEGKGCGR